MEKVSKQKYPRKVKGTVKAVNSGDYIVLRRKGEDKAFYLANILAPKMGTNQRAEEPFAFKAREFLREKVVGEKAEFLVEYEINGRECGCLFVGGKNMNVEIAGSGFVKINEKRSEKSFASKHYEQIFAASKRPNEEGEGIWSTDDEYHAKNLRKMANFTDSDWDPQGYLEESQKFDKPMKAIVEYVYSATAVNVYIERLQVVAKVLMNHVFTPKDVPEISQKGKELSEKLLFQSVVGVKLERVDDKNNLIGRIHHPQGEIALELVERGWAKTTMPGADEDYDKAYYKELRDAQQVAMIKNAGIWYNPEDDEEETVDGKTKKKAKKSKDKKFEGKVVDVHSGDSVTVQTDKDKTKRVFLASVKSPTVARRQGDDHEAWGFEAREFMRKNLAGKKVTIEIEYKRVLQKKEEVKGAQDERTMEFATIFQNEKNIACQLLEKGYAKTSLSKFNDDNSKYFEELIEAEKKAINKKIGLHSKKAPKIYRFIDTMNSAKQAKSIQRSIIDKDSLKAVVDYCFSGSRMKCRVDTESAMIAFSMMGIKVPFPDDNSQELTKISNDAKDFTTSILHQRDITIDVRQVDKKGTFFGILKFNGKNFALELLKLGLAQVNIVNDTNIPDIEEMEYAEEEARVKGIGIWKKELALLTGGGDVEEAKGRVEVEVVEVLDATQFYVRYGKDKKTYEKIEKTLAKMDPITAKALQRPIRKETLCAVRYTDGLWYRGRISRPLGKKLYEVTFMDFGNVEQVHEDDLKALPKKCMENSELAHYCQNAYLNAPKGEKLFAAECSSFFKKQTNGQKTVIDIIDGDSSYNYVLVFTNESSKPNDSLNAEMVKKGYACLDQKYIDDMPSEYSKWKDHENEAREEQLGLWEFGQPQDEDDY